ncbi:MULTISPECIES: rhomboid family intramembrane serine protease [unclassified Amycolatopsis]|uniref:rhomboid family intramembrane serine protease n=1 Tax=unclassified Amycolatopsis TaxID=2618356 RepID=UPI003452432E
MTNRTSERWHSNPFVAVFDRIGPRRAPVLTGAVFLVTAAALVAQLAAAGLLEHVRRDGAAIDAGQWWRLLTGMFFQDGGLVGGVFNLVVLAIFGTLAESYFGRVRTFVLYFGCGLFGQFMSYVWLQPVGAGNSMCVAGLIGALAVALLRAPARHGVHLPTQVLVVPILVAPLAIVDTLVHDNHGLPALLGMVLGFALLPKVRA